MLLKTLLFSLLCISTLAYAEDAKDYFGHWHVIGIADYANISAMSDAEAKNKIGLNLAMSEHSLKFNRHICKPHYEITRVETEKYLEEGYRISNERLKLPNPLVAIDPGANCSNTDISYIYVAAPNQVVFEYLGVFFRANRVSQSRATKQEK